MVCDYRSRISKSISNDWACLFSVDLSHQRRIYGPVFPRRANLIAARPWLKAWRFCGIESEELPEKRESADFRRLTYTVSTQRKIIGIS
jgi:hypothetical protein